MTAHADSLTQDQIAEARRRVPRAFARPALQRAMIAAGWLALVAFVAFCFVRFDVSPMRIWNGLDRLGHIAGGMFPPSPGDAFPELFWALMQSIGMAFLGTLIASIIAVPLGFMGARNILPNWTFRFVLRRHFDFLRGVDALVWALVYVRAVGLGPMAGVLAIATSDIGTLSKLFSEAIENAERKQVEGVRAAFESNTRSATILGIVGAGGIGFQLSDRIRAHYWDQVGFIIVMIIVAVALIDVVSHFLRSRLINAGTEHPPSQTVALYRRFMHKAPHAGARQ
jgi:phosphonate transport system permease protein